MASTSTPARPDPGGLRRLLGAMGYPRTAEFSVDEAAELCKSVAWLEDRKIRLYDIEQRAPLRAPGPAWDAACQQYLRDVGCPHPWGPSQGERLPALRWLFGKALACEYEDAGATYNAAAAANSASTAPTSGSAPPLRSSTAAAAAAEPLTEEFRVRVRALGERLGVKSGAMGGDGEQEETLVTLQGILSVVQMRLSPAAVAAAREGQAAQLGIDDFRLSYSTKDPVVDRVARALTLLYVSDLRELQNDINDILVSAQAFTANPKTNTALGKVGR